MFLQSLCSSWPHQNHFNIKQSAWHAVPPPALTQQCRPGLQHLSLQCVHPGKQSNKPEPGEGFCGFGGVPPGKGTDLLQIPSLQNQPGGQHSLPQQVSPLAQHLPPQTLWSLGQQPRRALGSNLSTQCSPSSQQPSPIAKGWVKPQTLGQHGLSPNSFEPNNSGRGSEHIALQLRNAAWHAINALPAAAAANGQAGGNTHPASNAVADAVQYASAVTQSSMQFLHLALVSGPG